MPLIDLIAGARPNFMKIAPILDALNRRNGPPLSVLRPLSSVLCPPAPRHANSQPSTLNSQPILKYRLIHTGQHYDRAMSGSFFEQLGIPEPDLNLEVGSGTQAEQTANIMIRYEQALIAQRADLCLVVGDVTSTMACAIVARKLGVPVAHVEGGIRSGDWSMPEEINRVVTDSITNWYFTTSETANANLRASGVTEDRIFFVGNTMIDTLMKQMPRLHPPAVWNEASLKPREYFVLTLHRPANVDDPAKLTALLAAIEAGARGLPVVFPVHPRTRKVLSSVQGTPTLGDRPPATGHRPPTTDAPPTVHRSPSSALRPLILTDPLGYLEFNYLVKYAKAVITDSGGITEETTVMGVPCLTLRDNTERPETVTMGTNKLVGTNPEKLAPAFEQLFTGQWPKGRVPEKWDGHAAERIVTKLERLLGLLPLTAHRRTDAPTHRRTGLLMHRLTQAWQVWRCFGTRWVCFRAAYALRQKSGWDAWRQPVVLWDAEPLAATLRDGSLASPEAYHAYRQQSAPRFLFSPARLAEGRSHFPGWDAESEGPNYAAERISRGEFPFFDHTWIQCGRPPDWHRNPCTGQRAPAEGHWSRLDEFGSGDIKLVWELSRFGWVFPLGRTYARTGDESVAECFWQLVEDWRAHNPPRAGVQWKCGQEASFRVMACCFGLYCFASAAASSPERVVRLAQMLAVTGQRIAGNLSYALSQSNNHGISEAAGLLTLGLLFPEFTSAAAWRERGRAALEGQARELIYDDGGFSQHSLNYHRVMLEDYLWCIQLGRANGFEFSQELIRRVRLAGRWVESLMDFNTGRLPNLGANDGAHVLPLTNCGYLDYRPVVQSAARVTEGGPGLTPGPWDEQAWWLGCPFGDQTPPAATVADERRDFPDSGLTLLKSGNLKVLLRTLRRFRHRPAQSDLLHLDLWNGSDNVLRDTGSYSYNARDGSDRYFKSVAAHNTIQFDGREQMPELGRFLYGEWPRGEVQLLAGGLGTVSAAYSDWQGCRHERTVGLSAKSCLVTDRISGFKRQAVLRWHLCPTVGWELSGTNCASPLATLRVTAPTGLNGIRVVEGWESPYYNVKTPLPVLEVLLAPTCREVISEMQFA